MAITQTALAERAEEVVVRGHDAELVQVSARSFPHESPASSVDDRDVVAVVAEDSLLGRGARGDVETCRRVAVACRGPQHQDGRLRHAASSWSRSHRFVTLNSRTWSGVPSTSAPIREPFTRFDRGSISQRRTKFARFARPTRCSRAATNQARDGVRLARARASSSSTAAMSRPRAASRTYRW